MAKIIVCSKCGEEKPHHAKGLCRACSCREWRELHKEESQAYGKVYNAEHKEQRSVATQAWRDAHQAEIKAQRKERYWADVEGANAVDKKWREDHPFEARERCRVWRKENSEYVSEYNKIWYDANPEKVVAAGKRWREEHPDNVRAIWQRRRARKAAVTVAFTHDQWLAILAAYDYCCAYCHKKFKRLQQDHVIPISKGGPHVCWNIVPACRSCNSSKGNRPPKIIPPIRLMF